MRLEPEAFQLCMCVFWGLPACDHCWWWTGSFQAFAQGRADEGKRVYKPLSYPTNEFTGFVLFLRLEIRKRGQ